MTQTVVIDQAGNVVIDQAGNVVVFDFPYQHQARITARPAPARGQIRAVFDANVQEVLSAGVNDRWQLGGRLAPSISGSSHRAAANHSGLSGAWRKAATLTGSSSAKWRDMQVLSTTAAAGWRDAVRVAPSSAAPWRLLDRAQRSASKNWRVAQISGQRAGSRWQVQPRVIYHFDSAWDAGGLIGRSVGSGYQQGVRTSVGWYVSWAVSAPLAGLSFPYVPIIIPGPEAPDFCPPDPGAAPLVFRYLFSGITPGAAPLIFRDPLCLHEEPGEPGVVIPIRRVYFMLNSAVLVRLPGLENIPVKDLTLAIDLAQFTWNLSATGLTTTAWDALQPDPNPVEVQATINGYPWRIVIDSTQQTRAFGNTLAFRIAGRGFAALQFAEPYISPLTFEEASARNVQQLAADVLSPSGWTLDWQAVDWLVDADTWAHYGTPISALSRLSEAAGGIVQADRAAQTVHVVKRFSDLPWAWSGAVLDVQIPEDVALAVQNNPRRSHGYNGVYVSGESVGVLAHVRRTATAGDVLATMISDPLMTDAIGARARGEVVLANDAITAQHSLFLPLSDAASPTVPLLSVGQLVGFGASPELWRGVVTGVTVGAAAGNDGRLRVRQQVTVVAA